MPTRINLSLNKKESRELFTDRITGTSDHQLSKPFSGDETNDSNYEIGSDSLLGIYIELYDLSQTNGIIPNDAEFYIDGKLFAKMVQEGTHLEFNSNISMDIIEKYSVTETINFESKKEMEQVYGETIPFNGFGFNRTGQTKAYKNNEDGNYIKDENFNKDFKNEAEGLEAIDFYMLKDQKSYVSTIDKTIVTVDGKPYKTFAAGKEIVVDKPELKKTRGLRR